MRTISLEEHYLSDQALERMRRSGNQAINPFYEQLNDLGEARLRDMDASSIDLQVLSHVDLPSETLAIAEEVQVARAANDQLAAAIAAHPTRFAGFALLPLRDPAAAVAEVQRTISALGFKGVLISGTTEGRFLDDPRFLPVLEQIAALDVPLYLHPAPPPQSVQHAYYSGFDPLVNRMLATAGWGWHSETAVHVLRLILAGTFDRLPNLRLIIGHMGEMLPFMLNRIDNTLGPAAKQLQRPISEYILQHVVITTSGFFTNPPLQLALDAFGADRILFSVDVPFSKNAQGRAFLDQAPLDHATLAKISHENAERVLKLSA